jgi:hypothetical protein
MTLKNRARQNTPLLAVKSGSPFWITEQDTECPYRGVLLSFQVQAPKPVFENESERGLIMSKEQENKDLVGRWFTGFWRKTYNPAIVDELAAPDMLLGRCTATTEIAATGRATAGVGGKLWTSHSQSCRTSRRCATRAPNVRKTSTRCEVGLLVWAEEGSVERDVHTPRHAIVRSASVAHPLPTGAVATESSAVNSARGIACQR